MSTVADPLKYRWVAQYEDGNVLEQPPNDRYSKHNDKADHNPSAFRDVLEYKSKLIAFGLQDSKGVVVAAVNLVDGHFEIFGVPFQAHDQFLDLSGKELKIIFHREVHIRTNMKNGQVVSEEHFVNRYFIGWQIVGEDVKQTIAVG